MDLAGYIAAIERAVDDPAALTALRVSVAFDATLPRDDSVLLDERIGGYLADLERAGVLDIEDDEDSRLDAADAYWRALTGQDFPAAAQNPLERAQARAIRARELLDGALRAGRIDAGEHAAVASQFVDPAAPDDIAGRITHAWELAHLPIGRKVLLGA